MGIVRNIATYVKHRGEWEEVCAMCGLCCHERVVYDDGEMEVDLTAPCEFLGADGRTCSVYDSRFEACPRCERVTLRKALSKHHLPPSCAYRRLFQ